MRSAYSFRLLDSADPTRVLELYTGAGWVEPETAGDFVPPMLKNSFLVAGAFTAGGELVGLARALSDGVSDAYIQDVVVAPDHRRRGLGGELVRLLVRELESRGVDWIGLVGAPGTRHFYEELGFEELKAHVPMRYRGKPRS